MLTNTRSLSLLAAGILGWAAPASAQQATPTPTPKSHKAHYSDQVMGTVVSLTIWTDDDAKASAAAKEVFEEFKRVDGIMSSWLPDSAVAQINSNAGKQAIKVNAELLSVATRSLVAAKATKGAFDITVGAFRGLWKFDQDIDGTIPDKKDVRKRTKLVGYRNVVLNAKKSTIKLKRKGMRITLGGVAKGYAVDRAVALLRERGLGSFIVQAGGDLYASGTKDGQKWRVGIRDPRGKRDASFALIDLTDATFSTSGDYERSLVIDGVRYNHILDPKTGYPATRSRSVTVKADDALTADIWSTALFVLGAEKGMPLVEKRPGIEAVFVDQSNKVHISTGLQGKISIQKPPTPGV